MPAGKRTRRPARRYSPSSSRSTNRPSASSVGARTEGRTSTSEGELPVSPPAVTVSSAGGSNVRPARVSVSTPSDRSADQLGLLVSAVPQRVCGEGEGSSAGFPWFQ